MYTKRLFERADKMGKINDVYLEYERLKTLFKLVDKTKAELVDNLLNEAALMKVQLSNLRHQIKTYGAIQISNKGTQRQTEEAKYYTKLVNSYRTIINVYCKIKLSQKMEYFKRKLSLLN